MDFPVSFLKNVWGQGSTLVGIQGRKPWFAGIQGVVKTQPLGRLGRNPKY